MLGVAFEFEIELDMLLLFIFIDEEEEEESIDIRGQFSLEKEDMINLFQEMITNHF